MARLAPAVHMTGPLGLPRRQQLAHHWSPRPTRLHSRTCTHAHTRTHAHTHAWALTRAGLVCRNTYNSPMSLPLRKGQWRAPQPVMSQMLSSSNTFLPTRIRWCVWPSGSMSTTIGFSSRTACLMGAGSASTSPLATASLTSSQWGLRSSFLLAIGKAVFTTKPTTESIFWPSSTTFSTPRSLISLSLPGVQSFTATSLLWIFGQKYRALAMLYVHGVSKDCGSSGMPCWSGRYSPPFRSAHSLDT
mmetsp:Transcript_33103/g.103184  ORF Transcript_33103/g.103184 Transcript_33103/m.103184 type:complete len:246 (-) Transcript_33103:48-785(-)